MAQWDDARLFRSKFRESFDFFGMRVRIAGMERYFKPYIIEDLNKKIIWGDEKLSADFKIFEKFLPKIRSIQLVKELKREKIYPDGAEV